MGTKKGNRRKRAVRGARLAYDAVPKAPKKRRRKRKQKGKSYRRGCQVCHRRIIQLRYFNIKWMDQAGSMWI